MTATPFHNRESFARSISRLIGRADTQGRGDDLDQVVDDLASAPCEVTQLSCFMMMLDEDWRLLVRAEVEAFRRWGKQKGKSITDDEIMELMLQVYRETRNGAGRRQPLPSAKART